MTRKQDSAKGKISSEDLKKLLAADHDLLKTIVEETLQQVLEAEMDEALQASKGEGRKSVELLVGYAERRLDTTEVKSVVEIHQALRTGFNLERELLGRIANIEQRLDRYVTIKSEQESTELLRRRSHPNSGQFSRITRRVSGVN